MVKKIKEQQWIQKSKCFQYAITVEINYNKCKKRDLQKILNIKPDNQYDVKKRFFNYT